MAKNRKAARRRWLAAALLLLLVAGGAAWREARKWKPARTDYPVQGVWLDANAMPVDWRLLHAEGADFAYLTATIGSERRDPAFGKALAAVRDRGMQAGAVIVYDACEPEDGQAANFVTTVPRDSHLLPPAVSLDIDPAHCGEVPSEAALQSELTTFLNQIERHSGKPAILMMSSRFEKRYHLSTMLDRNTWVEGDFIAPDYVARPWVLWTATDRLHTPASDAALRWVVVHP
ncbi:glycoside hydrolase family 25 protein [Novosphingobium sp. ZN18A2]|uniref:glycoside hydrolase family 25 protein n=1 Tax=Novosphingobium sp. ZN18A2 TaxID=3079861 RepID=UPI0030D05FE0